MLGLYKQAIIRTVGVVNGLYNITYEILARHQHYYRDCLNFSICIKASSGINIIIQSGSLLKDEQE